MYMTCQGNLFFLSGEEFARTKDGLENTYNAPIELNRLDWERAYRYTDLRTYYQGLIALRKQLPGLCDKSEGAWKRIFEEWKTEGVVGFFVDNTGKVYESKWKTLCVIYNSTRETVSKELKEGDWEILVDSESSFRWKEGKKVGCAKAAPKSVLVLGQRS